MKSNAKTTPHSTHSGYTLTTWQDGEAWHYQVDCPSVGALPTRQRRNEGRAFEDESSAIGHGTYRMDLIVRADMKAQK